MRVSIEDTCKSTLVGEATSLIKSNITHQNNQASSCPREKNWPYNTCMHSCTQTIADVSRSSSPLSDEDDMAESKGQSITLSSTTLWVRV